MDRFLFIETHSYFGGHWLLVVADFRFHLYAQLLFLIPHFYIFLDTVIYVTKAKYKITKICLIKGKHKLLFVANLKLYFYAQLLFLITFFWDTVICVIKAKYEINQIYVVKARHTLLVILDTTVP